MDLSNKKCIPCEVGGKPLTGDEIKVFINGFSGWNVKENKSIEKQWIFKDFKEAIIFVNKIAQIAENEGHHPDIHIHYNKVRLELWTHEVEGLTENDFILASKIEKIVI